MYIDRIDLTLPDADIASLLASFLSAGETLQLLPSVSDSDRKHYAKLGLKNEGLARRIIEVGRLHPDVIPRGINFEQIDRDLVARDQLLTLKLVLEGLLGKVNDSMLLTGVDIYAAALSIYHCLRRNAGTTGLRDVVEELKRGFARPSRKKKGEVEAAPASSLEPAAPPVRQPQPSQATPPVSPSSENPPPAIQSQSSTGTGSSMAPQTHSAPHTAAYCTYPAVEMPRLRVIWSTPSQAFADPDSHSDTYHRLNQASVPYFSPANSSAL